MTTSNPISTMEDIIRILREQPEIREAVRREILTEELLNLPRQVAEMAAILRDVVATLERHTEAISELRRDVAGLKTDMAEVKADVAELKTDVAELKGSDTFRAAERQYELIAIEMGMEPSRLLSPGDIARLAIQDAASEFSPSDLESFKHCDLMIAAESPTEGKCYIAVQVSRTVDHGDISRAITHSQMVTRFTDRPAYPAVAAFSRADVARSHFANNGIHWYRLRRPR